MKSGGDSISGQEIILRENWEHSRHCENQILWFTNIYAAVVVAILVFIAEIETNKPADSAPIYFAPMLLLSSFGLILSALGFFMVIALSLGHQNYIMNIVVILDHWDEKKFYKDPEKPFHFKTVHRWIFEFTTALFVVLFLFYLSRTWIFLPSFHEHPIWFIPLFVISFAIIEELFRKKWKKEFVKREKFMKELHPEFRKIRMKRK